MDLDKTDERHKQTNKQWVLDHSPQGCKNKQSVLEIIQAEFKVP